MYAFASWAYLLMMTVFLLLPAETMDGLLQGAADSGRDVLFHLFMYAAASALFCTAALVAVHEKNSTSRWRNFPAELFWYYALLLASHGIVTEFIQWFVPGRSGMDIPDLVANSVGAVLGTVLVYTVWNWKYRGRLSQHPATKRSA